MSDKGNLLLNHVDLGLRLGSKREKRWDRRHLSAKTNQPHPCLSPAQYRVGQTLLQTLTKPFVWYHKVQYVVFLPSPHQLHASNDSSSTIDPR